MDQSSGSWNLNSLDSVLTEGMKYPLAGVNTPYCYFGSWKSFFCWHTEDMELAAINFLHAGKTKYWYGIQNGDRNILEEEARIQFPQRFEKCPEHIRHKTTCMNPYKLKAKYPKLKIHKYYYWNYLDKYKSQDSLSLRSVGLITVGSTLGLILPKLSIMLIILG